MPQSDASTSSLTFAEKLLGLAGFTVRSVDFLEDGSLQVYVERKQWRFQCRRCLEHSLAPHSSTERKVRHLACFEYKVFLLVDVYRLFCPTCGVVTERHPLLALHHRCTERFASVVAFLCKRMSIQDVAGALQLSWHTVKEIDKEYIEAHLEDRDFSGLRRIGVDEIAFRTGHRYLTIVTDLDSHDVIWIGEGRESKSLSAFFRRLGKKICRQIEVVVSDMWPAYLKAVKRWLKNAVSVLDKFHLIGHCNKAIDELRRHLQAQATGEERTALKGIRFLLLYRIDRLNRKKLDQLSQAISLNEPLFEAYLLKERFYELFQCADYQQAEQFLQQWIDEARQTRIPQMVRLSRQVTRWSRNILEYFHHRYHNSVVEGINNKIKTIKKIAYGFRDLDYFKLKIFQHCSSTVNDSFHGILR